MAMNKAEKAVMQDLRARASLTLPPYERPMPVNVSEELGDAEWGQLFVGWHMNSYNKTVEQGCSNGIHHSRRSTTQTDSQNPGTFYRTKLEALRAMRWEMTDKVMRELGEVDAKIEGEQP